MSVNKIAKLLQEAKDTNQFSAMLFKQIFDNASSADIVDFMLDCTAKEIVQFESDLQTVGYVITQEISLALMNDLVEARARNELNADSVDESKLSELDVKTDVKSIYDSPDAKVYTKVLIPAIAQPVSSIPLEPVDYEALKGETVSLTSLLAAIALPESIDQRQGYRVPPDESMPVISIPAIPQP